MQKDASLLFSHYKDINYSILIWLDGESLINSAIVFQEVRKLCQTDAFREYYFKHRHGLIYSQNLTFNDYLKACKSCLQYIKDGCCVEPGNRLLIGDADKHRAFHEEDCIERGVYCPECGTLDKSDVRRIYVDFFNLYPESFIQCENLFGLKFSHALINVFALYVYVKGNVRISFPDNDGIWIPTENDQIAIERVRKIPKWFLVKYYEYIHDIHNNLYALAVKEANPGRAPRLFRHVYTTSDDDYSSDDSSE